MINFGLKRLAGEVKLVNFNGVANSVSSVLTGLFVLILVNNFLGLLPYVFTATSHPACTFIVAISSWAGYILYSSAINLSKFLAHLAPRGTPLPLIPFIVLIELIRSCMRPVTLGVRLAANMVAGHLLLVLARQPLPLLPVWGLAGVIVGLIALIVLELGVSFIQRYVFISLSSLYVREVHSQNL